MIELIKADQIIIANPPLNWKLICWANYNWLNLLSLKEYERIIGNIALV